MLAPASLLASKQWHREHGEFVSLAPCLPCTKPATLDLRKLFRERCYISARFRTTRWSLVHGVRSTTCSPAKTRRSSNCSNNSLLWRFIADLRNRFIPSRRLIFARNPCDMIAHLGDAMNCNAHRVFRATPSHEPPSSVGRLGEVHAKISRDFTRLSSVRGIPKKRAVRILKTACVLAERKSACRQPRKHEPA